MSLGGGTSAQAPPTLSTPPFSALVPPTLYAYAELLAWAARGTRTHGWRRPTPRPYPAQLRCAAQTAPVRRRRGTARPPL